MRPMKSLLRKKKSHVGVHMYTHDFLEVRFCISLPYERTNYELGRQDSHASDLQGWGRGRVESWGCRNGGPGSMMEARGKVGRGRRAGPQLRHH